MKNKQTISKRLKASLVIGLALVGLTGCSDPVLEMRGHVETIEYLGETCWIFVDIATKKKYEIITPSSQILRPNVQMQVRAKEVEAETLCELPTVIDIFEFKLDFEKDKR